MATRGLGSLPTLSACGSGALRCLDVSGLLLITSRSDDAVQQAIRAVTAAPAGQIFQGPRASARHRQKQWRPSLKSVPVAVDRAAVRASGGIPADAHGDLMRQIETTREGGSPSGSAQALRSPMHTSSRQGTSSATLALQAQAALDGSQQHAADHRQQYLDWQARQCLARAMRHPRRRTAPLLQAFGTLPRQQSMAPRRQTATSQRRRRTPKGPGVRRSPRPLKQQAERLV